MRAYANQLASLQRSRRNCAQNLIDDLIRSTRLHYTVPIDERHETLGDVQSERQCLVRQLATGPTAQELTKGITAEDLAKDNKLFIELATKGLHWDEPADPIKIVVPSISSARVA